MKRLLIAGDSFAAVYPDRSNWTSKINARVDNRAQAGVGQYKILQQLESNYRDHEYVLLVLTSEMRVYVKENPFYEYGHRHRHADLIFSDVESRQGDPRADHLIWWFGNVFDLDHARGMNNLVLAEMHRLLESKKCAWRAITFFEPYPGQYDFDGRLENFNPIWKSNPGMINHLNLHGHDIMTADINAWLDSGLNTP